jgi:hypothetical protein
VIILLTDSPPGGFDDLMLFPDDIDNAHLRATEAAAAGIKIAAIFTPQTQSQEVNAQEIMSSYATVTGGAYSKVQPFVAAPRSSATSPASWRSTGRRSRCARRLSRAVRPTLAGSPRPNGSPSTSTPPRRCCRCRRRSRQTA